MAHTMTRWQPFAEFGELRSRMDRLFADLADGGHGEWTPAIDVAKDEGKLRIRADVPGIKPEEIRIEIADDVLTISGEHEEEKETKDEHYVRRERRYGSFSRSIALPSGIDPEQINAKSHDGVLEIDVPLPSEKKPTTVSITPEAA